MRFAFSLSVLFFCSLVHAQSMTDGVLINADDMFRDTVKKTVKLEGHVQVVFQGQHLSCDRATMNLQTQQITAEGHVLLNNETSHVEGDRIVFNYKTNTGFIYKGFVSSGQIVFEGAVVEKVGEEHYIASDAEYTACETCPPGWSFSGRKIDAQIGGYARIQRPVFRIAGFPVLILPSLIVPLKTHRQSGFLVPTFGVTQLGGVQLGAVYFWAIDKSQDLTLTAMAYQKRGYKALGDYRYVIDAESKGEAKAAWMSDSQFITEPGSGYPANAPGGTVDRWYLDYNHYQQLPDGFVHRANVKLVSDLRYARDFPDELLGHGEPSFENKTSITHLGDKHYASAEVDVYTNLLKEYPLQNNDDAVNRFPELKYSLKEQRIGGDWGPVVRLDMDYINFARSSWNYDNLQACKANPNANLGTCNSNFVPYYNTNIGSQTVGPQGQILRTGTFVPGVLGNPEADLFRTGQRLDITPNISYPFHIWKLFDVLPSLTYRETQYRFDVPSEGQNAGFDETAARRYLQADVWVKTEFSKVFGNLTDPKGLRWKHQLEPELGYSQIPWMRKPNHPFFGDYVGLQSLRQYNPLSDSDIGNPSTGVQFDYEDRTYERRVANFVLTQRLTKKVWNDDMPDYQTVALFSIGQSFDFKEAERDESHPWSTIDSILDLRFNNFETFTTSSYDGYANKNSFSTRLRGMLTKKNFLQFSYVDTFIFDNNYQVVPNSEARNYGIGLGYVSRYFEVVAQLDYSDITHNLFDWSYGLNLRPPGRCWLIHFEQVQVLGGEPQFKAALNFDFGGETKDEALTRSQVM